MGSKVTNLHEVSMPTGSADGFSMVLFWVLLGVGSWHINMMDR